MAVRKPENSKGIRLWSPGVRHAMIPDTVIRAATRSKETPIYHVITFQFIAFRIPGTKLWPGIAFINTIIFIFALIKSIRRKP